MGNYLTTTTHFSVITRLLSSRVLRADGWLQRYMHITQWYKRVEDNILASPCWWRTPGDNGGVAEGLINYSGTRQKIGENLNMPRECLFLSKRLRFDIHTEYNQGKYSIAEGRHLSCCRWGLGWILEKPKTIFHNSFGAEQDSPEEIGGNIICWFMNN